MEFLKEIRQLMEEKSPQLAQTMEIISDAESRLAEAREKWLEQEAEAAADLRSGEAALQNALATNNLKAAADARRRCKDAEERASFARQCLGDLKKVSITDKAREALCAAMIEEADAHAVACSILAGELIKQLDALLSDADARMTKTDAAIDKLYALQGKTKPIAHLPVYRTSRSGGGMNEKIDGTCFVGAMTALLGRASTADYFRKCADTLRAKSLADSIQPDKKGVAR